MGKKGTPTHKAHDYVESTGILPDNGDTKVVVCSDSSAAKTNYTSGSCQTFGRTAQLTGVQGFGDNINSLYIPLGLKAMIDLDYLGDGNYGGNKDQSGVAYNLTNSGPAMSYGGSVTTQNGSYPSFRNGWNPNNGISTLVIGQTPINMGDVGTFTNLESRGVGTNDAKDLRFNFCNDLTKIDRAECKNFFSIQANGFDFHTVKTNLCNQDPNWTQNPSCVAAVNAAQKANGPAVDTATSMVRTFCDANPSDELCGCYNVTKYGQQCLTDNSLKDRPGCREFNAVYAKLPSSAAFISQDAFCGSSVCITKALSSNEGLMPVGRSPSQTCPTIQACIQNFENAQITNSEVSASCRNVLNLNGSPQSGGGGTGEERGEERGRNGGRNGGGTGEVEATVEGRLHLLRTTRCCI
jgi:hypothetical protein